MWVVVARSCANCDERGAALYDHAPSEKEIDEVASSLGGMTCIQVEVFSGEVNCTLEKVEEIE